MSLAGAVGPISHRTLPIAQGERFDGYRGKYAFHCHDLEHEDLMMANFEVV